MANVAEFLFYFFIKSVYIRLVLCSLQQTTIVENTQQFSLQLVNLNKKGSY